MISVTTWSDLQCWNFCYEFCSWEQNYRRPSHTGLQFDLAQKQKGKKTRVPFLAMVYPWIGVSINGTDWEAKTILLSTRGVDLAHLFTGVKGKCGLFGIS